MLSEYAYHILSDKDIKTAGAELQMVLLAKELAKKSFDVSFITFVKTTDEPENIHNIKVYNPFDNKYKGITYLNPKNMFRLLKTLKKIDADVYIQRSTTPLTGIISFYAKLTNKKFIYSSSSERDVSDFLKIKSLNDIKKLFFKFGVKNSDYVLCQTKNQKKLLKRSIGKQGKVIKNFYPLLDHENGKKNISKLKIIWAGRITRIKRPELFLKLAKKIPEVDFWMMGGPTSDIDFYNYIKKEAEKINNLTFLGPIPYKKINNYYDKSSIFINTSNSEGFPNTFLEAWGHNIPVISIGFDPDEIICKNNLGFHSKDFNQLVKDTKKLIENQKLRIEMGKNGRKYVEKEHDIDKLIKKYINIFKVLT